MTQYTDNLIPVMTSNTTPSGVASCSSVFSNNSAYNAYKAFNRVFPTDSSDCWIPNSAPTIASPVWLRYNFESPKKISLYTITPGYNDPINLAPMNWTFEGSNDGANWVVLDIKSGVRSWNGYNKMSFPISNNNNYYHYQIKVTSNALGNSSSYLAIGELEMMESIIPYEFLIKQGLQYYSIKPEFYSESNDEYNPTLISTLDDNNFDNYAIDDISSIHSTALNKLITDKFNVALLK